MSAAPKQLRVDVLRRVQAWSPSRGDIANWASMALGRRAAGREIGVSVVGPTEIRRLNSQFRGRNKPTNVLSFPAARIPVGPRQVASRQAASRQAGPRQAGPRQAERPEAQPLGDLVICPQVLRAEAREQRKSLRAHWAHLVVHGALHLIGYDHEQDADASRMERREISVLRRLGFENPYRSS